KRGDAASFTVTAVPQNGFNSAVALSCSGLPAGASCAFSPASVTPNNGAATANLKITTTSASAVLKTDPTFYALCLPALSFCLVGLSWLPQRVHRRKLVVIAVLLIVAFVIVQAGCGGGSKNGNTPSSGGTTPGGGTPPPPSGGSAGTPVGTYTVTVLATSSSIQHPTNIQLNVQ